MVDWIRRSCLANEVIKQPVAQIDMAHGKGVDGALRWRLETLSVAAAAAL